jgi:hypothetical protein
MRQLAATAVMLIVLNAVYYPGAARKLPRRRSFQHRLVPFAHCRYVRSEHPAPLRPQLPTRGKQSKQRNKRRCSQTLRGPFRNYIHISA